VLGQEVATLVNEVKQPGSYEVVWNASRFASGVYFYRLTVTSSDGSPRNQQTKKMLLIK